MLILRNEKGRRPIAITHKHPDGCAEIVEQGDQVRCTLGSEWIVKLWRKMREKTLTQINSLSAVRSLRPGSPHLLLRRFINKENFCLV